LDQLNVPQKYIHKGATDLDPQTEQSIVMSHFSPETCICADNEEFLIDFDRRLLYILPKPREFDNYRIGQVGKVKKG
jgi:hypothetical protein